MGRQDGELTRREAFRSAAAAGAGLVVLSRTGLGQEAKPKLDDLNIALVGAGGQGRILLMCCLKIPGVRFKAVCDIWSYSRRYASNILKRYKQPVNAYTDYREMLAKEKDLDAVLIATPDWVHAQQAIACLKAGKHVYCEKEMSNTLEGCKQMVLAARQSGKLLQIGHQRRSNPRYHHGLKLIEKEKLLGRVTHTYAQWNRARRLDRGWPKKYQIDKKLLAQYGYDTMERFRNWRWYRKYSGGPIADLGSHQVDIFNWFLRAQPKAVLASGGVDYYKQSEWYDNLMAIYEYQTQKGPVRGFYQVLNTTSYGGYYEVFMGDEGSLTISENINVGHFFRELQAKRKEWEDMSEKVKKMGKEAIKLAIGKTREEGEKDKKTLQAEADVKKPVHQPHLESFFNAIRSGTPLTCPPEVGYETAVSVLKVNDAVAAGRRLEFKPEEFKV